LFVTELSKFAYKCLRYNRFKAFRNINSFDKGELKSAHGNILIDTTVCLFIISHTNKLQFRHSRRISSCTSVLLGSRLSSIIAVESSPVCQFNSYNQCLEITAIYCEFLFAVHYLLCVSLLRPCQRVKFGLILYFRIFESEDCRRISYLPCGY